VSEVYGGSLLPVIAVHQDDQDKWAAFRRWAYHNVDDTGLPLAQFNRYLLDQFHMEGELYQQWLATMKTAATPPDPSPQIQQVQQQIKGLTQQVNNLQQATPSLQPQPDQSKQMAQSQYSPNTNPAQAYMPKPKQAVKQASIMSGYGWLSPQGEFYPTNDHLGFLMENPELFGKTEAWVQRIQSNQNKLSDYYISTIWHGWIRFVNSGNVLNMFSKEIDGPTLGRIQDAIGETYRQFSSVQWEQLDGNAETVPIKRFMSVSSPDEFRDPASKQACSGGSSILLSPYPCQVPPLSLSPPAGGRGAVGTHPSGGSPDRYKTTTVQDAGWNLTGADLPMLYHGGKEFINDVDPDMLQSRDHGFYGRGFYCATRPDLVKGYGGRVSGFAVDPGARVLRSALNAADAPSGLIEGVEAEAQETVFPKAEARGKGTDYLEELARIHTSPLAWKSAVDEFGTRQGYDIIWHSDAEVVVKNLNVLRRVPVKRQPKTAADAVSQTDAFQNWFGKSQIIDESGQPLTVYHGTTAPEDFSEFSVGYPVEEQDDDEYTRTGSGPDPRTFLGSHFARETSVANGFAKGQYGEREFSKGQGGRVYPVFLRITKPYETSDSAMLNEMLDGQYNHPAVDYELQDDDKNFEQYEQDPEYRARVNQTALDEDGTNDLAQEMAATYRSKLQDQGYDGIIYDNEIEGGTSYIVFDPSQVKSVFNRGGYSPESGDILAKKLVAHTDAEWDDIFVNKENAHRDRVHQNLITLAGAGFISYEDANERGEAHDHTKFMEPLKTPYQWRMRHDQDGIPYPPGMAERVDQAVAEHRAVEPHHVEAHAKPSDMPDLDLAEMVCDWYASGNYEVDSNIDSWMAENGGDYDFTDDQWELIHAMVDTLQSKDAEVQAGADDHQLLDNAGDNDG